MEEGYDFIWRRGKSPYFITPDKRIIRLAVENYTPWLVEREDSFACPAGVVLVQAGNSEQPSVEIDEGNPAPEAAKIVRKTPDELRAEANSIEHLMTHFPKNKHCDAWSRAKMQQHQTPDRSGQLGRPDAPTSFGEILTADHFIASSTFGVNDEKMRSCRL